MPFHFIYVLYILWNQLNVSYFWSKFCNLQNRKCLSIQWIYFLHWKLSTILPKLWTNLKTFAQLVTSLRPLLCFKCNVLTSFWMEYIWTWAISKTHFVEMYFFFNMESVLNELHSKACEYIYCSNVIIDWNVHFVFSSHFFFLFKAIEIKRVRHETTDNFKTRTYLK